MAKNEVTPDQEDTPISELPIIDVETDMADIVDRAPTVDEEAVARLQAKEDERIQEECAKEAAEAVKEVRADPADPGVMEPAPAPAPGPPPLDYTGVPKFTDDNGNELTDNDGRPYHPELHESDPNNPELPAVTSKGNLRKKRGGGAAKKHRNYVAPGASTNKTTETPTTKPAALGRGSAAVVMTQAVENLGMFFTTPEVGKYQVLNVGTKESPIEYNEQLVIFTACNNYLEAVGVEDLPPGLALAVGLSGYGLRLAKSEPAQIKAQSWFANLKDRALRWWYKSPAPPPDPEVSTKSESDTPANVETSMGRD